MAPLMETDRQFKRRRVKKTQKFFNCPNVKLKGDLLVRTRKTLIILAPIKDAKEHAVCLSYFWGFLLRQDIGTNREIKLELSRQWPIALKYIDYWDVNNPHSWGKHRMGVRDSADQTIYRSLFYQRYIVQP